MRDALKLAKVFVVNESLSPDLELTRFISHWIQRYREQPTFLFTKVQGSPSFPVVMNLLKREIILRSLRLPSAQYLPTVNERLAGPSAAVVQSPRLAVQAQDGMSQLPVLRHQPREVGRYLTSFIGCLHNREAQVLNLGFYRVLLKGERRGVIFMDPRTDAYRIVKGEWDRGASRVPITLFMGGPISVYLSAAAKVPFSEDSYGFAARLSANPLLCDGGDAPYPAAPAEAEVVLHGSLLPELEPEAPFGEFKGYYCKPTMSPVLEIERIFCRPDPYYFGLFCGHESGLTLMSLQNEIFLFKELRAAGFAVEDVTCPLAAFGEFLTLVQTPQPSRELLDAALAADQRTKIVVVAEDTRRVLRELSVFNFSALRQTYTKRGQAHGDRLGLVVGRTEQYEWVEY